jgi:hypothetical protein
LRFGSADSFLYLAATKHHVAKVGVEHLIAFLEPCSTLVVEGHRAVGLIDHLLHREGFDGDGQLLRKLKEQFALLFNFFPL